MKKLISLILLFTSILILSAQQKEYDYKKIDSLLNDPSIIGGIRVIKLLEKDFIKDSISSIYWVKLARAYQISHKSKKAIISIEKAVKKDSTNAKVHADMGSFYGNLKKPEIALEAFSKAILINPNYGGYYYYRGIINQQLYLFNAAENDYKNAIINNYETAHLYNQYATLYLEKGNYKEALALINKALFFDDNFAEAYSTRAIINYFLLDFKMVCIDEKMAEEMGYNYDNSSIIPIGFCDKKENEQLEFAAQSFTINGRLSYKEAIIAYTKLIDNNNNNSNYFLNRGYVYHQLGYLIKAEKDYLKTLTLPNTDKAMIYENLILVYFEQKRFKKALKYCEFVKLESQDAVFYNSRGAIYVALNNYKVAEEDFNKALEIDPNSFETFGNKSFLYFKMGAYKKSKREAQKSVDLNPKYAQGFALLGQAKYKLGITGYCTDFLKAQKLRHPLVQEMITLHCN
ncbi:MAG: tetratricopeptide repeat protein [Flavobacteriaceae bacterium]|nr:tetratricopeptide repeat protein [Flavobacteriaceae bacterium]